MSNTESHLSVTSISIKNAFGIRDARITPGRVTVISGKNQKGKTSILKSIESAVDGGRAPGLLNHNADTGEVVLVLSDETEIKKKFSDKSCGVTVSRDGANISSPQSFLNEITASVGCNPLKLLKAPKSARAKIFMDSLPIKVDDAELSTIAGTDISSDGKHGIEVIDDVYQSLYQTRRDLNRDVSRIEKSIQSCQKIIEDYEPEDVATLEMELDVLKQSESSIVLQQQADCAAIDSKSKEDVLSLEHDYQMARAQIQHATDRFDAAKLRIEMEFNEAVAKLKNEADQKIAELTTKHNVKTAEDKQTLNACDARAVADVVNKANAQKQATELQYAERLNTVRESIAKTEAELKAANRAEPIMEEIMVFKKERDSIEQEVDSVQVKMNGVLDYKKRLFSELNFEWFDYRDKQIYIDGVEFEAVNTARLIRVAVELARLQSPTLKLMCIDGGESLDAESMALLGKEAESAGMDLIVTRVDNNDGIEIASLDGDLNKMKLGQDNYAH